MDIKKRTAKDRKKLQNPTLGATINKESTTGKPPPMNGQQPKPWGLKCNLLVTGIGKTQAPIHL